MAPTEVINVQVEFISHVSFVYEISGGVYLFR